VSLGATTDAEATGNGSLIGINKRIRTLLGGGLPSALSAQGNLKVALAEGTVTIVNVNVAQISGVTAPTPRTPANSAALVSALPVEAMAMRWNGASADLWQGPTVEQTALASAIRTATTTSPDQVHRGHGFLLVCLRITAASGTGGLQLQVSLGNLTYPVYLHSVSPSTPITSTGRFYWVYGPGLRETGVPTSGVSGSIQQHVNVAIVRDWRVHIVHNDASSYTYSVTFWEV
jgi:hypothetical protein